MNQRLFTNPARTPDHAVPEWIIERAAVYMVRRYGVVALNRAVARHRFLLHEGDEVAATHWIRVAEAIAVIARGRARKVEALS